MDGRNHRGAETQRGFEISDDVFVLLTMIGYLALVVLAVICVAAVMG